MEHTSKLKISDCVVRNNYSTFDLVLTNLEFQKHNVKNVSLSVKNSDEVSCDLLEDNNYRVYAQGILLYDGKFTSGNHLFKYEDIPFSKIIFYNINIVFSNISEETIKKMLNYTIEVKWTESNIEFNSNDLHNINDKDIGGYKMKWTTNLPTEDISNYLLILEGICGTSDYFESYSDNYIQSSKNICSSDETNQFELINFNNNINTNTLNYYESEFDIYSNSKMIKYLVKEFKNQNNSENKLIEAYSETYKIPIQKITVVDNLLYTSTNYIWSGCDGISNIQLLCDNLKYKIVKITWMTKTKFYDNRNNLIERPNIYQLDFEPTDFGYKISGLDNFTIIPNVGGFITSSINITFITQGNIIDTINFDSTLPADFWIKLDRYTFDTNPRRNIAKDFYSYNPTVDLTKYLTKN